MRVLVTGATGFLGQRLVRELLVRGMDVCCLVRASSDTQGLFQGIPAPATARLKLVRGSLEKINACAHDIEGCEVLFHVAAAMRGAAAVLFLNNVVATRQLISVAARSSIRRLVLVSSLGVYGTGNLRAGDILNERCPLDSDPHRRDSYTFSKIAQEKVAWEAHSAGTVQVVVIRPGVLYGPGRDCMSNRLGLRLGPYLLKMGGQQRLPYTFVDNCANALYLAGTVPGIEGEAFNIVDDNPPTAQELLYQYRSKVERMRVLTIPYWLIGPLSRCCEWYHEWSQGQLPPILTPYKSAAQWKPLHYANDKAKACLGWSPETDFARGIPKTLRWLCDRNVTAKSGKR